MANQALERHTITLGFHGTFDANVLGRGVEKRARESLERREDCRLHVTSQRKGTMTSTMPYVREDRQQALRIK